MKLRIRRATQDDCMKVFELSNDPVVRQNAINQEEIIFKEHVEWFKSKISSPDCEFFIVEDDSGDFVGQVRFDKIAEDVFISISVSADFRGKKLGARIINLATEKTSFGCIVSRVKKNNIPSFKAFQTAGYVLFLENEELYTLNYNKEECGNV